uniref:mucin-1 n=1 Tax=Ictidomys tridecemlineatus TaxID=43179 RepID=UPI001A9E06CC|nr:mucin-1 [Ictidomys tridecemlineatus]
MYPTQEWLGRRRKRQEVRKGEGGRSFVTCHLLRLCLGRKGGTGIKQQAPVPLQLTAVRLESALPPPHQFNTTMTPGIQSPFFLLLLLPVLPGQNSVTLSQVSTTALHSTNSVITATPSSRSPSSSATGAPSSSASTPAHNNTSAPTAGTSSASAATSVHSGTSTMATTTLLDKGTKSSVSSQPSDISTTAANMSNSTVASSNSHSTVPPFTSSNLSSPSQVYVRVSFFSLSFYISNLKFNSSLENPRTNYYQELQRNISELVFQVYKQDDFLGLFNIMFRPGSVVTELTLVFREGTTNAKEVMSQFYQLKEEGSNYNLNISRIKANEVLFPSSAQSGSGVPGWGIALLVLVCVLLALAILYLIALAVCQCRQKNYGHLDIFPSRETYHPMSEYPTYHTHGRYMPPGSTNRSPYEEVSAGNGGGSLSYTNPAVAATSANL